jgi:hypothetical protein
MLLTDAVATASSLSGQNGASNRAFPGAQPLFSPCSPCAALVTGAEKG